MVVNRDGAVFSLETILWTIFNYTNLLGYFKFVSTIRDRVDETRIYRLQMDNLHRRILQTR